MTFMLVALLTASALASEPAGDIRYDQARQIERIGMYVALPGLVLDAVDRPQWSTEDDSMILGTIGRVASYGGLATWTFGAMGARSAVAGAGSRVAPKGLVLSCTFLGAALAFDLAALGGQPGDRRAFSGTAAAFRIGSVLALTAQDTANARGREAADRTAPSLGVGLSGSADRVAVIVSGAF